MISRLVTAIFILGCATGWATEVVWVRLTPLLSYRDISTNCQTGGYFHHYLGAEVDSRGVKAAVLSAGGLGVSHRSISLSQSELAGLRFQADSFERVWVTDFSFSERLTRWVLENSGGFDGCKPTQALVSANPSDFTFSFKLETLGTGPSSVSSNFGKFGGTRKDGRAYQAKLYFLQEQM